jgi:tRNA threonylcarbamoyladenosine biosynthesis protein TsaE
MAARELPAKSAETSPTRSPQEFLTRSPEETIELGRRLAQELKPPAVVLLIGDLGAGKTTLTKGLVAGLGAADEEEVTSPTFTLVHEYGGERIRKNQEIPRVYHVDLYRIETPQEMITLGLEDLVSDNQGIVIVEWGEKMGAGFRNPWPGSRFLEIHLEAAGEDIRRIGICEREAAQPG